jgi:transcriptional regulator with XRE-family HTH domain
VSELELIDALVNLPRLLRETREARGLSANAAGRDMGISSMTVSRIENGRDYMVSNALVVLRWVYEVR